jgi:hypothetical protein
MQDLVLAQYDSALAAVGAEIKLLSKRLSDLGSDHRALQKMVLSRKEQLGILSLDEIDSSMRRRRRTLPSNVGQKSIFLRKLLQDRPGLTGPEMRDACQGHFEIKSNFPYTLLGHWLKTGKARRDERGKYFLIEMGMGESSRDEQQIPVTR